MIYCMILYLYVHVLKEDTMKIFMMKIFIDSGDGDDLCQLNIIGGGGGGVAQPALQLEDKLGHCLVVLAEVPKETGGHQEAVDADKEEAAELKDIVVVEVDHVEDVEHPANTEEQQGVGLEETPHGILLVHHQDTPLDGGEQRKHHKHDDHSVVHWCEVHVGGKSEDTSSQLAVWCETDFSVIVVGFPCLDFSVFVCWISFSKFSFSKIHETP